MWLCSVATAIRHSTSCICFWIEPPPPQECWAKALDQDLALRQEGQLVEKSFISGLEGLTDQQAAVRRSDAIPLGRLMRIAWQSLTCQSLALTFADACPTSFDIFLAQIAMFQICENQEGYYGRLSELHFFPQFFPCC